MITRRPMKRVSDKRRAERGEYDRAVQRAFARDRHTCRAVAVWPESGECSGRLDPHHVLPLGRGGPRCDVENIYALCRRHHDAVHAQPMTARELGLLR